MFIWLYRKPGVEPCESHASPLSDASKKRLIEDTEDWHPRTGTSQSRSFQILAQLTGTEKGVCSASVKIMQAHKTCHLFLCF